MKIFATILFCVFFFPYVVHACSSLAGLYTSRDAKSSLTISQEDCSAYTMDNVSTGVPSKTTHAVYMNDHQVHLDPLAVDAKRYYKVYLQNETLNIELYHLSQQNMFWSIGVDVYELETHNNLRKAAFRQHYESPEPGTIVVVSDPTVVTEFNRQ